MYGRGAGRGGQNSAGYDQPGGRSKGMYDTLVTAGIEKRMNANESEIEEMKQKLAQLQALRKQKAAESGVADKEEEKSDETADGVKKEMTSGGVVVEHQQEGFTEKLMDHIFVEMFEEVKGYRPTKLEIDVFKQAQLDDYDNELEEYEAEAEGYAEDGGDDFCEEYMVEEDERQRLLAEMLKEEDNFDVCTDGAVFFDVEAQMKELNLASGKDTATTASSSTAAMATAATTSAAAAPSTTTKTATSSSDKVTISAGNGKVYTVSSPAATSATPPSNTAANFKLNASAKEWKPTFVISSPSAEEAIVPPTDTTTAQATATDNSEKN